MGESYTNPDVLVSTDWLEENLQRENIRVVEVNTDVEIGYNTGHIEGSIVWDLHKDLESRERRDIPSLSQIEELFNSSGIGKNTTVILYGDGNNRSATWAFWILKYYRHSDVRLLNGGRTKWIQEGRALSSENSIPKRTQYKIEIPDKSIRATKDYILKSLGSVDDTVLVDTRTVEEYSGKMSTSAGTDQTGIYRNGRIPNSIHIQWDDGASANGAFLPELELRALYNNAGISPDKEIIPYCRLGMRASYTWFVLKYLLGYDRVRNYDGSWTEWGNSIGLPIEIDT